MQPTPDSKILQNAPEMPPRPASAAFDPVAHEQSMRLAQEAESKAREVQIAKDVHTIRNAALFLGWTIGLTVLAASLLFVAGIFSWMMRTPR